MKIAVLLKQVPDTETRIKIRSDNKGIDESQIKWVINPYDEIAVEEALKLKEKVNGEVTIVSLGPVRCVEAIRQALAMGADKGIHIDTQNTETDTYTTSIALANTAKKESFDIIFTGKQAMDDDASQVSAGVAELLDIPHVSPVEKFSRSDNNTITIQRPVSGGLKEIIEVKTPVVIGCEKGLNEPRYASLPGIMKAKSKPVSTININDVLQNESLKISINSYTLPPERKAGKIIEGEEDEAIEKLVRLLRDEAKII